MQERGCSPAFHHVTSVATISTPGASPPPTDCWFPWVPTVPLCLLPGALCHSPTSTGPVECSTRALFHGTLQQPLDPAVQK